MERIIFLTLEQIIVIHDNQIRTYGGSHGIRDLGLLESAAYRIRASFAGSDLYPSVFNKAAALMHSLVLNHAFVDGNKRTAAVSTLVFLELNNYKLVVAQKKLVEIAQGVQKKKIGVELLALWLKKHSDKL